MLISNHTQCNCQCSCLFSLLSSGFLCRRTRVSLGPRPMVVTYHAFSELDRMELTLHKGLWYGEPRVKRAVCHEGWGTRGSSLAAAKSTCSQIMPLGQMEPLPPTEAMLVPGAPAYSQGPIIKVLHHGPQLPEPVGKEQEDSAQKAWFGLLSNEEKCTCAGRMRG